MNALPSKIITHAHLPKLNEGITKLQDAVKEAKLGMQAGIVTQATLDDVQARLDKLLQLKRTYFPGQ